MNIFVRSALSLFIALAGVIAIAITGVPSSAATMQSPISISVDNYQAYQAELAPYAPFSVYGWCTDPYLAQRPGNYQAQLDKLAAVSNVDKAIIFSSLATLQAKIGDAPYWHSIGVTRLMYNTEGELTPAAEMATLNSPDPNVNAVALFAAAASGAGFSSSWGPIRNAADGVSDNAIKAMMSEGLGGIGLQEQKFIEIACAADRLNAVKATIIRYRRLAAGRPFTYSVQIMAGRCLSGDTYAKANCSHEKCTKDYDHCRTFLNAIRPAISEVGIFAMGMESEKLPAMIQAIRKLNSVYLPLLAE
jgi:hypothetical protein